MSSDPSNALGSGAHGFHARSLSQAYLLGELAMLLEMRHWPSAPTEQINERVEVLWHSVVELLGLTPAQRAIALDGPPPDSVSLSGGVPVARWAVQPQRALWGRFEVVFADAARTLPVSTPFRPAAREDFPDGTTFVPIRDPHHSAQACAAEMLDCMRRDFESVAVEASTSWRQVCALRSFYAQAGQGSIALLAIDQYRDWNPVLEPFISPLEMARVIADRATAQAAHRNLSMGITYRWFGQMSAAIEGSGTGEESDWVAAVHQELIKTEELLRSALDASNQLLLARQNIAPGATSPEVVFSYEDHGLPAVAAVPIGAVRAPTPLTSPG